MFGNGVNQQFFLSSNPGVSGLLRGTYLSVSFCWGIGVMVGVYVAGGISGAHLNPAVVRASPPIELALVLTWIRRLSHSLSSGNSPRGRSFLTS